MEMVYLTEQTQLESLYAATIGFFDGVHCGHRFLINRLKQEAKERGLQSMVITFERHPRQVLHSDWQPRLLSSLKEKQTLLRETGIDMLVVLRFDAQMAALSAGQFMNQILFNRLGVRCLLMGYDNRFGHNREENVNDYQRYGKEIGIDVVCGEPFVLGDHKVSSSLVRHLLEEGRVEEAARCLGRSYSLVGTVVHGEQIGRRLGYPTANMQCVEGFQLVPRAGVYGVRVQIGHDEHWWNGMTNIGMRPTFHGHEVSIETNIFDFTGEIYQQPIRIAFLFRVRDEQVFPSPEALQQQVIEDEKTIRNRMGNG